MHRHRASGQGHRAALVMLPALLLAACGSNELPPVTNASPPEQPRAVVHDLSSIQDLRDRFEEDAGSTRLVLLISPT